MVTLSELKASCVYLILSMLNITAITWYFIGVVEVFRYIRQRADHFLL